jgi:hypothetical protein
MQVMSKNKVYNSQSFFDKVIECTGSIENAFKMALLNGISVTDDIVIGQQLKIPPVTNKVIVEFFGDLNRPATMITQSQIEEIENIGIGKMIIGTNFIVT